MYFSVSHALTLLPSLLSFEQCFCLVFGNTYNPMLTIGAYQGMSSVFDIYIRFTRIGSPLCSQPLILISLV